MNIVFLVIHILIPIVTCHTIKKVRARSWVQLSLLLFFLAWDTYCYYSAQINEVRAREWGGYWPWGKAGISEEALFFGAIWSADDYTFIDHLFIHHYFYIFLSGLAFYTYIHFYSRVFDYFREQKEMADIKS